MYIDKENRPYFGDMQPGDREATPEEVAAWEASRIEPEKTKAKRQIAEIERETLMNRAVREFMLAYAAREAAANALTLDQLYAVNPAYKAVKDVDTQIVALRGKLK